MLQSIAIFVAGGILGSVLYLFHPSRVAQRRRQPHVVKVLEEVTVAHAHGRHSVRLPLELAFRVCDVEPLVHWFYPAIPKRHATAVRVHRDHLEKVAGEIAEGPERDAILEYTRSRRFALEALSYIEVLEDELVTLREAALPKGIVEVPEVRP